MLLVCFVGSCFLLCFGWGKVSHSCSFNDNHNVFNFTLSLTSDRLMFEHDELLPANLLPIHFSASYENGKLEQFFHWWMKNRRHNDIWLTMFPEIHFYRGCAVWSLVYKNRCSITGTVWHNLFFLFDILSCDQSILLDSASKILLKLYINMQFLVCSRHCLTFYNHILA